MNIGGIVKNSFVDYPHKIAFVIFTTGCNMRCWYCHNSHLFNEKSKFTNEQIYEFLQDRKDFLDGVVVSGGEPTLQKDLIEFISHIKSMGYLVKLDTNGSNYQVLEYLIKNKLVDYVAMDIKAPFDDYHKVVRVNLPMDNIIKSKNLLLKNVVNYEFRTTFSPDLTLEDIDKICEQIKGAKNYSIQRYRQVEYNKENLPLRPKDDHIMAMEIAKKYIQNVTLKGVD